MLVVLCHSVCNEAAKPVIVLYYFLHLLTIYIVLYNSCVPSVLVVCSLVRIMEGMESTPRRNR